MTTVSSVIKEAMRETNLIGIGKTPTTSEYTEGLTRLQNVVSSVFGNEMGEQLSSYDVLPSDTKVPYNTRLMLNNTAAMSLELPENPRDGARLGVIDVLGNLATYPLTIDGNGRKIEGSTTLLLNTNSVNSEWFYRGDTGNWVKTTALTLEGDMPFPSEFDDFFITMLAMRLNPRHGQSLSPESVEAMKRSRSQFKSRYRQEHEVESELALQFLSLRRYYRPSFETGVVS